MSSPLVAVPAFHLGTGRVSKWMTGAYALPEQYVLAARRAGLGPVAVTESAPDAAVGMLDRFDGLMLLGGEDIDPPAYGAEAHPTVYGVDRDRDAVEIALVHAAVERGVPTLAICRGLQVVNVAFGGTLHQHLPDVAGLGEHGVPGGGAAVLHDVKVAGDSRLAKACGAEVLTCSCHHHQGVDTLGDGLVPTAWSDDGLVEGAELGEGWTIAVQWHPEDTAAVDPAQQALFDAFAERTRDRAAARPK